MSNNSNEEAKAGIYTTLVFHLSILIVLLLASIGTIAGEESSFVLDFSKQEEKEEEIKEEDLKEEASRQVAELLSALPKESIRNVAVDAGAKLKDNTGKTGTDLYKEAAELQKRLDASKAEALREMSEEETVDTGTVSEEKEDKTAQSYTGPSILRYSLEGRKAVHLPIPAYKGERGGDVYVAIWVNQQGRVVEAKIKDAQSCKDGQLRSLALDAAKRSRFSAKTSAPAKQEGEIVYRFIKQ